MLRTNRTASPPAASFPAPRAAMRAGVGFKNEHLADIEQAAGQVGFFEIHAENYMGAGGPPLARLERLRRDYELSIHGVGLSLGGAEPLDVAHLKRWKALIDRFAPFRVSEHLAWSGHAGAYFNDLLPLPYTPETLSRVCARVSEFQDALGRRALIENPATYVRFAESSIDEIEFLSEVSARSGCGLLLDVNNVYVSCVNHGRDPQAYIDAFPMARVEEIHLAGFREDRDDDGARLLIDAHCASVAGAVWSLYARAVARAGAVPTLIEWDNEIPPFARLRAEAERADALMRETLASAA